MKRQDTKEQLQRQITPAAALLLGGASLFLANRNRKLSKEVEQLKRESVTDHLTGLTNRRGFEIFMTAIGSGVVKPQGGRNADKMPITHPYSLLLLDVDRFKSINDTYNHAGGDEVLVALARILENRAHRNDDLPARLGGEEFALVLPGANLENASHIAELIRKDAESSLADPLRQKHGQVPDITVSIGVGELDLSRPIGDSLEAIDGALYYAKEHGRNQVVTVPQVEA